MRVYVKAYVATSAVAGFFSLSLSLSLSLGQFNRAFRGTPQFSGRLHRTFLSFAYTDIQWVSLIAPGFSGSALKVAVLPYCGHCWLADCSTHMHTHIIHWTDHSWPLMWARWKRGGEWTATVDSVHSLRRRRLPFVQTLAIGSTVCVCLLLLAISRVLASVVAIDRHRTNQPTDQHNNDYIQYYDTVVNGSVVPPMVASSSR